LPWQLCPGLLGRLHVAIPAIDMPTKQNSGELPDGVVLRPCYELRIDRPSDNVLREMRSNKTLSGGPRRKIWYKNVGERGLGRSEQCGVH